MRNVDGRQSVATHVMMENFSDVVYVYFHFMRSNEMKWNFINWTICNCVKLQIRKMLRFLSINSFLTKALLTNKKMYFRLISALQMERDTFKSVFIAYYYWCCGIPVNLIVYAKKVRRHPLLEVLGRNNNRFIRISHHTENYSISIKTWYYVEQIQTRYHFGPICWRIISCTAFQALYRFYSE